MKVLRSGKNAVTPYKIDTFGGAEDFRVGTSAEDTPLKFQLKTRRSARALCRFCVTGQRPTVQLQQVILPRVCETTLFQTRYHATFWVLQHRRNCANGAAGARHLYRLGLQFSVICSSLADSLNLRSTVGMRHTIRRFLPVPARTQNKTDLIIN